MNNPIDRIPDIIDEQELARLLANQGDIVDRHETEASLHISAQAMASELVDYLGVVAEKMTANGLNGAAHVAKLKDYAEQLQAHHLDCLDRLNPA